MRFHRCTTPSRPYALLAQTPAQFAILLSLIFATAQAIAAEPSDRGERSGNIETARVNPADPATDSTPVDETSRSAEPSCGAMSPSLIALGDAYYDLDIKPVTGRSNEPDGHRNKLQDEGQTRSNNRAHKTAPTAPGSRSDNNQLGVLEVLTQTRFNSGRGTKTECYGSGDYRQARTQKISLKEITIRTQPVFQKQFAQPSNRDSRPALAHNIEIQALEFDPILKRQKRQTMLIRVTADELLNNPRQSYRSSSKHRQKTFVGSYLQEVQIIAALNPGAIDLQQRVYINGALTQWQSWQLLPQ